MKPRGRAQSPDKPKATDDVRLAWTLRPTHETRLHGLLDRFSLERIATLCIVRSSILPAPLHGCVIREVFCAPFRRLAS